MATLSWDALQPRGGADAASGARCWTLRVLHPSVEVAHAPPLLAAAGGATLALPCLLSSPPASAHCVLFHTLNVAAVADERDDSAARADALSEHVGELAQALADGPVSSRLCALAALRAVLDEPGGRCRAVTHPPAALLDALVHVATANAPLSNAPLAEPPSITDAFFSAGSSAFWGQALRRADVLPARATDKDAVATLDALCVLHALHCLNALLHAVAEDSEASAAKLAGALLRRGVGDATLAWSAPQTYGVTVLRVMIPTARLPLPCRDAAACGTPLVTRGRTVAMQLAAALLQRGLHAGSVRDPRTPYPPPLNTPEAAVVKPNEMLLSRLLSVGAEVFMEGRATAAAPRDDSTRAAAALLLAELLQSSAALRHEHSHTKGAIELFEFGLLDVFVALARSGSVLSGAARAAALAAAAELALLARSAQPLSSLTALLAELLSLPGDGDAIMRDAAVQAMGKLVHFAELRSPFMRDQRAQLTSLTTSVPGCGADAVLRAVEAPPTATLAANAAKFPQRSHPATLAASSEPEKDVFMDTMRTTLSRRAAEAAASAPAVRAFAERPTCAACGAVKLASALKRSSACSSVLYCDATCQKGHWKAHKAACRAAVKAARQQQQ